MEDPSAGLLPASHHQAYIQMRAETAVAIWFRTAFESSLGDRSGKQEVFVCLTGGGGGSSGWCF